MNLESHRRAVALPAAARVDCAVDLNAIPDQLAVCRDEVRKIGARSGRCRSRSNLGFRRHNIGRPGIRRCDADNAENDHRINAKSFHVRAFSSQPDQLGASSRTATLLDEWGKISCVRYCTRCECTFPVQVAVAPHLRSQVVGDLWRSDKWRFQKRLTFLPVEKLPTSSTISAAPCCPCRKPKTAD